jgi:hypothetical protein
MLGFKRLQFNIIIHRVSKFAPMKNLRSMLFPILWVDEVRFRIILMTIARGFIAVKSLLRQI